MGRHRRPFESEGQAIDRQSPGRGQARCYVPKLWTRSISQSNMNHQALIAVGSNQGDRSAALVQVLESLRRSSFIDEVQISPVYETRPVGGSGDQPTYLNAVIRVTTRASAPQLHQYLIELESQLGRERRGRWESRTIDLDLLLVDDQVIRTHDLIVPHPRMSFRRFVLRPAVDVAANWIHPICQVTIERLLRQIDHNDQRILVFYDSPKVPDVWTDEVLRLGQLRSGFQFQRSSRTNPENEWPAESRPSARLLEIAIDHSRPDLSTENAPSSRWQIQTFDRLPAASVIETSAKLAVTLALDSGGPMRQWVERNWRGPRLDLPSESPEAFVTETCAAIEAMQPWDEHRLQTHVVGL